SRPARIAACEINADTAEVFDDVGRDSTVFNDVGCIYTLRVTTGTSPTTYSPQNPVTRAQMASFLARLYQELNNQAAPVVNTPFNDIAESPTHADNIARVYGLGITTGTSDTTYSPQDPVTRAQMASFLARLYEVLNGEAAPIVNTPFNDIATSPTHADDIARVYGLRVTNGTSDTTYSPQDPVTRAQMASFLTRLYRSLTTPSQG
ncbi:MAG: S-layer homology domain-containing protein, partial [Acidimicrobiaceae bacterium]|nr:S-layer homology domain-containing protein [Acidimicrobiaceae bacterium]